MNSVKEMPAPAADPDAGILGDHLVDGEVAPDVRRKSRAGSGTSQSGISRRELPGP